MGEAFQGAYNASVTSGSDPSADQSATPAKDSIEENIDRMVPLAASVGLSLTLSDKDNPAMRTILITPTGKNYGQRKLDPDYDSLYEVGHKIMVERCRHDLIERMADFLEAEWYLQLDVEDPDHPGVLGYFVYCNMTIQRGFHYYAPSNVEGTLSGLNSVLQGIRRATGHSTEPNKKS